MTDLKELIIEDLGRLTHTELAKVYKFIRSEIISGANNAPTRKDEDGLPSIRNSAD